MTFVASSIPVLLLVQGLLIIMCLYFAIYFHYKYKTSHETVAKWRAPKRGPEEDGESLTFQSGSEGHTDAGGRKLELPISAKATGDTPPDRSQIDKSIDSPIYVSVHGTTERSPIIASASAIPMDKVLKILVVGPQGSGKSSLANTIIGGHDFPVGHNTAVVETKEPKKAVAERFGKDILVMDTPFIFDRNRYSEEDQRQQVSLWKRMTSPGPSAILFAVSWDDIYNSRHYDHYQRLMTLWHDDEDFCRRLIVVFTFVDKRRTPDLDTIAETHLRTENLILKHVIRDAGYRYFEVSNKASQKENRPVVRRILELVEINAKTQAELQRLVSSDH